MGSQTTLPQTPKHNGENKLRIKRKRRFATKPSEYLIKIRAVFLNYCATELQHSPRDLHFLGKIFDNCLDKDNIMGYINTHSKHLYDGLTNNRLQRYYQQPKED